MMINITNQLEMNVNELPIDLYKKIKADLTLPNPEYLQAIKMGRNTYGIPQHIQLYRVEDDTLILPRGYGSALWSHARSLGIKIPFQDNRLKLPSVNFHSTIKLRDYQSPAVDALVKGGQGGVVAGCGAGKTMIMLEAMARIGQPALWITHTQELLEQVIDRATSAFDMQREEIGIIGGGKFSIGERLTVALVQTLAKAEISEFKDRFGAIFVDEAHRLAAKTFFHPVGQFPALYRCWASATPNRADGLTQMVFAAGGPILHTVDQSKVPTLTPRLEVIETEYIGEVTDYVQLVGDVIRNAKRNSLIVETIAKEARGNYSLVLSDRVEHLELLVPQLRQALPDLTIEILTGSMKKKERVAVMERVQNKQVDILLATQLAREGLDIKHLNRLFLTTPKRAAGAVEQEVGRVMRPCEGKTESVVFDFWDVKNPILKPQFWKRRDVYTSIGMKWTPGSRRRAV